MTFPTEEFMKDYNLFWQYPVITEETFFRQNKNDETYLGLPWATIIDRRYDVNTIYKLLIPYLSKNVTKNVTKNTNKNTNKIYYTCCQHIHFRRLIPLFKILNIKTIYCPHKLIGEDSINTIKIIPCPLYAANIEDDHRNSIFKEVDFINIKRKYLYTFQGAYDKDCYLTNIREIIFNMKHPDNCYIKNIGFWHFNNIVYSEKQNVKKELNESKLHSNNTQEYNKLLLESRFSLCPSGSGPNSIRLWESLATGSIPIILADTLELPEHELWENTILRVKECDIGNLSQILANVDETKEREMRENCIKLYKYFRGNYKNCNLDITNLNITDLNITNICKNKNMVIFSNCHGEKYINIMKRDTNIANLFNINYIVSYMQLDNFEHYKNDFCNADILIINNIKNYNDYTINNLKKFIKQDCLLIIIPFVRFEGYWMPETYKKLYYIKDNAVSFFPEIDINIINKYLTYKIEDKEIVLNYFTNCLKKLKEIENECDIKFYDYFIKNHKKYPFFRDNYHPTANMIEYIGKQIIYKIKEKYDIYYKENYYTLKSELYEYGHYKPIIDSIKNILELEYNVDTIFICDRYNYIYNILNNENNKQDIIDLDDMKVKLFYKY